MEQPHPDPLSSKEQVMDSPTTKESARAANVVQTIASINTCVVCHRHASGLHPLTLHPLGWLCERHIDRTEEA